MVCQWALKAIWVGDSWGSFGEPGEPIVHSHLSFLSGPFLSGVKHPRVQGLTDGSGVLAEGVEGEPRYSQDASSGGPPLTA